MSDFHSTFPYSGPDGKLYQAYGMLIEGNQKIQYSRDTSNGTVKRFTVNHRPGGSKSNAVEEATLNHSLVLLPVNKTRPAEARSALAVYAAEDIPADALITYSADRINFDEPTSVNTMLFNTVLNGIETPVCISRGEITDAMLEELAKTRGVLSYVNFAGKDHANAWMKVYRPTYRGGNPDGAVLCTPTPMYTLDQGATIVFACVYASRAIKMGEQILLPEPEHPLYEKVPDDVMSTPIDFSAAVPVSNGRCTFLCMPAAAAADDEADEELAQAYSPIQDERVAPDTLPIDDGQSVILPRRNKGRRVLQDDSDSDADLRDAPSGDAQGLYEAAKDRKATDKFAAAAKATASAPAAKAVLPASAVPAKANTFAPITAAASAFVVPLAKAAPLPQRPQAVDAAACRTSTAPVPNSKVATPAQVAAAAAAATAAAPRPNTAAAFAAAMLGAAAAPRASAPAAETTITLDSDEEAPTKKARTSKKGKGKGAKSDSEESNGSAEKAPAGKAVARPAKAPSVISHIGVPRASKQPTAAADESPVRILPAWMTGKNARR